MSTLSPEVTAEQFAERVMGSLLGTADVVAIAHGKAMGWYDALGDGEWKTASEVAASAGTNERYTREWLEQQAASGILDIDASREPHRFRLLPGPAEAVLDPRSQNFVEPLCRMLLTAAIQTPAVRKAYQDGGGVGWAAFGPDMRKSQADANRPFFEGPLTSEWIPAMPEVHERLQRATRVAEIGCGAAWASIAIARAYPQLHVDAFDIDPPSVELARGHVAETGCAGRVTVHEHDASDPSLTGRYDLVFAFECIHDMPYPVAVLQTMRRLAGPDGLVVVMDEGVSDEIQAPGDDLHRLMYAFSLLICLPDGMAHPDSAGTGTVMRPAILERYAKAAGFAAVEPQPFEAGFWRFTLLRPTAG
jgi:SAM-dependent methyltransferase